MPCSDDGSSLDAAEECSPLARRSVVWYWIKVILLFLFLGFLAVAVLKWVGPYFIGKEVIPIINWETETFSPPALTILVFASVALFPTILLPSTPSMWVAGMKYGYGFGFLLIIPAVDIGVSLPFLISQSSIRKLKDVVTNVKYGPYIIGSLVGIMPEIFVAIYTGILFRTLADATNERQSLSAQQIIFNALDFCITVATIIIITVYARVGSGGYRHAFGDGSACRGNFESKFLMQMWYNLRLAVKLLQTSIIRVESSEIDLSEFQDQDRKEEAGSGDGNNNENMFCKDIVLVDDEGSLQVDPVPYIAGNSLHGVNNSSEKPVHSETDTLQWRLQSG
ncbi:hypothetical protein KIW84_022663 [Lathyrus oleraceus]|uniref:Uncharacterized protein n=1 Tax=Pisum sativum TaxID=3888 RepID=A0A9D4YDN4_PEA|nr:hypothetical protein KIW84_022663 [Pisum sativum]